MSLGLSRRSVGLGSRSCLHLERQLLIGCWELLALTEDLQRFVCEARPLNKTFQFPSSAWDDGRAVVLRTLQKKELRSLGRGMAPPPKCNCLQKPIPGSCSYSYANQSNQKPLTLLNRASCSSRNEGIY